MGCFACFDAVDATSGQEKEFDAANSLFSIKSSFLRFLPACLHWREVDGDREVGGGAGLPQRVYGKQGGGYAPLHLHLNHLSMQPPPN